MVDGRGEALDSGSAARESSASFSTHRQHAIFSLSYITIFKSHVSILAYILRAGIVL